MPLGSHLCDWKIQTLTHWLFVCSIRVWLHVYVCVFMKDELQVLFGWMPPLKSQNFNMHEVGSARDNRMLWIRHTFSNIAELNFMSSCGYELTGQLKLILIVALLEFIWAFFSVLDVSPLTWQTMHSCHSLMQYSMRIVLRVSSSASRYIHPRYERLICLLTGPCLRLNSCRKSQVSFGKTKSMVS